MRYLAILLVLVSFGSLAETVPNQNQEAFDWFVIFFNDIYEVVEGTPSFIERSFAYFIEFAVYLKFLFMLETLDFAYGVAQSLIINIGLDSLISDAVSRLPAEYRGTFQAMGLLKSITMLCEAWMVRFVMNFMGW